MGGLIAARSGDYRNAAVYGADAVGNHCNALMIRQGCGFAGGAADGDGSDTGGNLELDELGEFRIVDGTVCVHRGNDGNAGAGKQGRLQRRNLTFRGRGDSAAGDIALGAKKLCQQSCTTGSTPQGVVRQADKLYVILGVRAQTTYGDGHAALQIPL